MWAALNADIVDQQNMAAAFSADSASQLQAGVTTTTTAKTLYHGLAQGYGFKFCGVSGA